MEAYPKYPNRLYAWIKHRGYQLYEVARDVDIPQRTLHNYCKGHTPIPRYRLEALARFLECSISALVGEPASPETVVQDAARKHEHGACTEQDEQAHGRALLEAQSTERGLNEQGGPSVENGTDPLCMATHQVSSPLPSPLSLSTSPAVVTSRRQLLQEMLSLAGVALLTPPYELLNEDTLEHISYTLHKPASLDERVLTDLDTITNSLWRTRAYGIASSVLLDNALGHFRTVIHLNQRAYRIHVQHRLHSVTRNAAQLLGHLLFDMRDFAMAWSYYTLALNAAQMAHQPDEEAAVLGLMSFVLTYKMHPSKTPLKTLDLLERAQLLTASSMAQPLRASLAAIKAEVHANVGQYDASQREIDRAQNFLIDLHHRDDVVLDDMFNFDRTSLAGYQGACLLRVGRPLEALRILQDSVQNPQMLHAVRLTHIGIAQTQLGAYNEACDFGHKALSLIVQTRSRSQFECVQDLRSELEVWKHTPEVKDFGHHIEVVYAILQNEREMQ